MANPVGWVLLTPELPGHGPGGIGSWAEDLARALHQAGETVEVWAPARRLFGPPPPWRLRTIPGHSWHRWGPWWVDLYARIRRLPSSAPTLIAATWPLATRIATRWPGPVLVAAHGSDLTRWDQPPPALVALAPHVHFLPVSGFLAQELDRLGLQDAKRTVLPMAIPNAPPSPPSGRALVCVARATPLKGIDRAATFALRLSRPLWLVGCTATQVRQLHPQLSAEDHPLHLQTLPFGGHPGVSHCFGPQSRGVVEHLLRSSAGAVLFARADPQGRGAEGLGLSLLEAAHLGRPTLGSPVGGLPEALGPGRCLDPEDPLDADHINTWLDDPQTRRTQQEWVRQTHTPERALHRLFAARAAASRVAHA